MSRPYAAHHLDAEAYWTALSECGCFDAFDAAYQARLRQRLLRAHADDPDHCIYAIATVGFDMGGMVKDGDGCCKRAGARGDCCSYRCALRSLALNSHGHFKPRNLNDRFDHDAQIVHVEFEHDGELFETEDGGMATAEFKRYVCDIPMSHDWFDLCILDLVNDAMALGGSRFRFLPLPFFDQFIYLVLMSDEAWSRSRAAALIPADDHFYESGSD
ncbi:MAG: hypothetical protein RBU37_02120 [Myxococcota bacterium]|jgi:hypothetical protein|nr:hypothetical protein [Myxococcota bacterium]